MDGHMSNYEHEESYSFEYTFEWFREYRDLVCYPMMRMCGFRIVRQNW